MIKRFLVLNHSSIKRIKPISIFGNTTSHKSSKQLFDQYFILNLSNLQYTKNRHYDQQSCFAGSFIKHYSTVVDQVGSNQEGVESSWKGERLHDETFYKRPLPPDLIPFASQEGKVMFREALEQNGMENYFVLAEQFNTQSEPAFCGLASLTMVFNALQIDPLRQWKFEYPWRWYVEDMLDCCVPIEKIKRNGVNMNEFFCIAKCNTVDIQMKRYTDNGLDEFRKYVIESCTHGKHHIVCNFSRTYLKQTGDGHFSPIGGYHKSKDHVLLLDLARFKYPSYWVPLELLYKAMKEVDSSTNKPRGYFLIKKKKQEPSIIYNIFLNHTSNWRKLTVEMNQVMTELIHENNKHKPNNTTGRELEQSFVYIFDNLPEKIQSDIAEYSKKLFLESNICNLHKNDVKPIVDQLQQCDLYALISKCTKEYLYRKESTSTSIENHRYYNEILTILFLSIPHEVFQKLPYNEFIEFLKLRELSRLNENLPELKFEVEKLREILKQLCDKCGLSVEEKCS